MIYTRKTIFDKISLEGVGVHTGKNSKMNLYPSKQNGIIFIYKNFVIPLDISYVTRTQNAVTLSNGKVEIKTIEHLLAALSAFGITDLIVELDHFEVPILDGSAFPIYKSIEKAGIWDLEREIDAISIKQTLYVKEKDKYIVAYPSDKFSVSYKIDFDHPLLKNQKLELELNSKTLKKDILKARTFGFRKDIENFKSMGLGFGASEQNTIVFNEDNFENSHLRYKDEAVRHKILDLVGDLYVLGRPILGHFVVYKAGHKLDIEMAKLINEYDKKEDLNYIRDSSKLEAII